MIESQSKTIALAFPACLPFDRWDEMIVSMNSTEASYMMDLLEADEEKKSMLPLCLSLSRSN
jgi:hypothetical protein